MRRTLLHRGWLLEDSHTASWLLHQNYLLLLRWCRCLVVLWVCLVNDGLHRLLVGCRLYDLLLAVNSLDHDRLRWLVILDRRLRLRLRRCWIDDLVWTAVRLDDLGLLLRLLLLRLLQKHLLTIFCLHRDINRRLILLRGLMLLLHHITMLLLIFHPTLNIIIGYLHQLLLPIAPALQYERFLPRLVILSQILQLHRSRLAVYHLCRVDLAARPSVISHLNNRARLHNFPLFSRYLGNT